MKAKIMIVEDDEPLRGALEEILMADGYQVEQAATLAELRQALTRGAQDAVILDLKLPDGNGLDLLPAVKKKWPGAKVIILTGHGTMDAALTAYQQIEDVYFQSKPFDAPLLKTLLELALSGKPA
ncbi:MAG: hypothetical protein C5B50_09010 [Verrucomicrobia bacterium]|nr:MAG: hypothetical protein C5B50_09010 [Verrucomicrobiota bacterium]